MKKDTHKTDVVFRIDTAEDSKGTIFALLPHECDTLKGDVVCYQHLGQHSSADYYHCIKTSKPATPKEYNDLKREMESFGYNFNVIKRQNRQKYLKSYRSLCRLK